MSKQQLSFEYMIHAIAQLRGLVPMSKELPATPIDAYKAIVDQLVTETSRGISERLVVEEGIFSKELDARALNACVQSLSVEQRRLLSEMLHCERISAI